MKSDWRTLLERWRAAGLVDDGAAARIAAWEDAQCPATARGHRLDWPVLLALILGGIALGAGVLLFVAAHWDAISQPARFSLVVLMVALFHVTALFSEQDRLVRATLHALGTIAFGAGIALAAQIFHLAVDWNDGLLLWTLGAWTAWGFLRDAPHTVLVALATPWWLATQVSHNLPDNYPRVVEGGLLAVAITYLTAVTAEADTVQRRTLLWVGNLAFLPCFFVLQLKFQKDAPLGAALLALALPMLLAFGLRGALAWRNAVAAGWILLLLLIPQQQHAAGQAGPEAYLYYVWSALAALGLVAWGWAESRVERINLGVVAFALTVLNFYVSSVFDKLGRSLSLILLGVLLLGGGWLLERVRRRLTAAL